MRAPIAFTYGNCVFANGCTDPWAVFALDVCSYEWLSADAKRQKLLSLLGALEALEADIQVLRVGRPWDVGSYAQQAGTDVACAVDAAERREFGAHYVAEHLRRLREIAPVVPEVFICVSLSEPARDVASFVSRARPWIPG